MPLDAQKYTKLKGMLDSGAELSDDVRSQALAAIEAYENEFLSGGWGGAQNRPAEGVSVPQPAAPAEEDIAQQVLRRLDPGLPVPAQALAIQPSTTHPRGDQAAAEEWSTGRLDNPNGVAVVYEAPVAKVRERLMEQPGLFQALGYEAPMTPEAVMALEASDPVVQSYNDYEWRRVADAATKAGKTAYRYSRAPFMHGGDKGGALDTLGAKLKFGALPALDIGTAFVMGYDEAASFGAANRVAETGAFDTAAPAPLKPGEEAEFDFHPTLGKVPKGAMAKPAVEGASVLGAGPHEMIGGIGQNAGSTVEQLDMLREEHPAAVTAGEVVGTAPGLVTGAIKGAVGTVSRAGAEAVERGLGQLSHWNPANHLWDWVTNNGKGWVSKAANPALKVASDVAHAGAGAAADQLTREGVRAGAELGATGETSVTAKGAFDRGLDAAKFGATLGAVPAVASRTGSAGRQLVEDRFPHIEEAAPHLQWGASSVLTGPRLVPETRQVVREARRRKVSPVGTAAEEISPAIAETAATGTKTARGRRDAERSNFQNTPEGTARQPATHLERASLEELRSAHQPQPDGSLKAVDNSHREAQRVFNRNVADVSLTPVEGAIELTAAEAGAFLDRRAQGRLLKEDIEAAAANQKPVDRKAYLATQPQLKRGDINEEIEAAIDDMMPVDAEGAVLSVDQRTAAYKDAEQQVLRERVGAEMVLEPFGDSLAAYLKQRGSEKIYVQPEAYDARRTDRVIEGLKNQKLKDAAEYDRDQFTKGGERGGYSLDRRRQDRDVAKAEDTEKRVAPGGDAFPAVVRHGFPRAGDEKDVAAMREVAGKAGPDVSGKLDKIRSLNSALDVTGRSWFAGKEGGKQGIFSLGNQADFASLRAYPVLRSLDTMGGLARGGGGRLGTIGKGDDESEKRRRERDEKRAPAYRAATKESGKSDTKGRRDAARKKRLERVRAARQRRAAGRQQP
jgi:hypothetical protein